MMMEKILMQPKQVRFGKVVKFILPTYLTSLFNTLYTIVDGIFVSACVGTNALAAINIVYPIVNILTGIALAFATGGGAFAAISLGAGLATILGLVLSCGLGIWYFCRLRRQLRPVWRGMEIKEGVRCAVNGASECVSQLAIAITTVVFNRTALALTGEDGIAAVSIIMYLQFLFIGLYFGYSMGIAPLLSHGYGQGNIQMCRKLERYSYRFFAAAPPLLYGLAFLSAPLAVSCFAQRGTAVWTLALEGMRLYGLGYLVAGLNIFTAIRLTSYGKGHLSAVVTLLRSFVLLIVFLLWLPKVWGMAGLWLAMPLAEIITIAASVGLNQSTTRSIHKENQNVVPGDPVTE